MFLSRRLGSGFLAFYFRSWEWYQEEYCCLGIASEIQPQKRRTLPKGHDTNRIQFVYFVLCPMMNMERRVTQLWLFLL